MDRKKKIAHLQLLPLLSGVQIMMLGLLKSLDPSEYDIYVISKPGGALVEEVKAQGYHHIPVKSFRRNLSPLDILSFFRLLMIFKKEKFDIVHTHSSKPGFLGRIAARVAGVKKIIHTVHGFPFHQHQPVFARFLYRTLERIAAHFCDKIVVVNNFEREAAVDSKLINKDKIVTIYNGIEIPSGIKPRFYPQKKNWEEVFRLFGRDIRKNFLIGSTARFTAAKNIKNLIKIAVRACNAESRLVFAFIGDGELFSECKAIVEENGLTDRIILPGWQDNVKEWLDIMDVFILYSLWEGLSIAILEAMAFGLPIIASDIKGNNELITNNNGKLIDVNDHNKMVEELVALPKQNDLLTSWSKNSLLRIKEIFSYEAFVKAYHSLYQE